MSHYIMSMVLSRSKNPVAIVRALAGLTLAQASEETGCHLQAFFLQEQGVYPHILPAIGEWLKLRGYYLPEAEKEYREFQRQKRVASGEQFGVSILELGPPNGNPIVDFRQTIGLSRMGLAKHFCIHPGLLYRVEQGITRKIPVQLSDALLESGLPAVVLSELSDRMEER
jgi:hypothetical protein